MLRKRIEEIKGRANELCDMEDVVLSFISEVEKELNLNSNGLAKAYRTEVVFQVENCSELLSEVEEEISLSEEEIDEIVDRLMSDDYLNEQIVLQVRDTIGEYLRTYDYQKKIRNI